MPFTSTAVPGAAGGETAFQVACIKEAGDDRVGHDGADGVETGGLGFCNDEIDIA